jgi:hypothetical protein
MSLHPQTIAPVPEALARVALAAIWRGSAYMALHDEWAPSFAGGRQALK